MKPHNDLGTVWISEGDEKRFLVARSGDFLHFSFQCDLCWFRNFKFRSPQPISDSDSRLLEYIRRVNLDGMWSREPGTVVRGIKTNLIKRIKYCEELSLNPDFLSLGPWSVAFLDEVDWFWWAHDLKTGKTNEDGICMPKFKSGIFVWTPAPASAQFAVE